MQLNESTINKLEELLELTLGELNSGIANMGIKNDLAKLGPRPKVQSQKVAEARKKSINQALNSISSDITITPGGKK